MKPIYHQVNQYLDYCESARKMSTNTLRAKHSICQRFIKITKCQNLKKLTNQDFSIWTEYELKQGSSPRTINTYNACILAMVNYYREMGMAIPLKTPLVKKLKEGPTRQNFYTISQIKQVIKHTDQTTALMIKICFDGGLRIAELARLKKSDVNGCRINFIGKGTKPREIYLSKSTAEILESYIEKRQISNYLWPSHRTGSHLAVNSIRKRLKKAFKEAGFDDFYPHSLRHSFATDLQFRGATVPEIQQMLGHASMSTTERYLHALDGHLEELFAKYR